MQIQNILKGSKYIRNFCSGVQINYPGGPNISIYQFGLKEIKMGVHFLRDSDTLPDIATHALVL